MFPFTFECSFCLPLVLESVSYSCPELWAVSSLPCFLGKRVMAATWESRRKGRCKSCDELTPQPLWEAVPAFMKNQVSFLRSNMCYLCRPGQALTAWEFLVIWLETLFLIQSYAAFHPSPLAL